MLGIKMIFLFCFDRRAQLISIVVRGAEENCVCVCECCLLFGECVRRLCGVKVMCIYAEERKADRDLWQDIGTRCAYLVHSYTHTHTPFQRVLH